MAQLATMAERVGAEIVHRRPGPIWAFIVGGLLTVAAVVLLHRTYPHRNQLVALGFVVVVAGCIDAVTTARREASAAAEEVAMLRLTLQVREAECQRRIDALEAEASCHSRALARLLAD